MDHKLSTYTNDKKTCQKLGRIIALYAFVNLSK